MFGIKQFEAVINPPQAMIMAVGTRGAAALCGRWCALGRQCDERHRQPTCAIDGADGARTMQAFKDLIENPLGLVVRLGEACEPEDFGINRRK